MAQVYSVVVLYPEDPGHQCGYCKSTDGFIAQGMWAHLLNVEQYQQLIDRGWRRSGCYCYKPVMHKMCCPTYTIRCDATQLRLTKSQKKVARRMRNFLLKGRAMMEKSESPSKEDTMDGSVQHGHMELEVDGAMLAQLASRASGDLPQHYPRMISNGGATDGSPRPPTGELPVTQSSPPAEGAGTSPRPARPGSGIDPARPACRKKKEMRRERWRQKHGQTAAPASAPAGAELEDLLAPSPDAVHKLEMRLVRSWPPSEEYQASKPESYLVYKQYQMSVHRDPEDKCTMSSYERFLGSSPLKGSEPYGSYHQQYWLDGELIAVGVLDVLPSCVSSKYFFYLPSYGFLSLGTYSSLRELALTRHLQRAYPDLRYYYMGYYIHTCPKMRYKGRLSPSYLLCPETYAWQPITACTPLLDRTKYARLAPASAPAPPVPPPSAAVVLYNRRVMHYNRYRASSDAKDEEEVRQYMRLVGPEVAASTLLVRD